MSVISIKGSQPKNPAVLFEKQIADFLLLSKTDLTVESCRTITAIHVAAMLDYVEVVKNLLKAGFDINQPDDYDLTPLHMAIIHNRYRMVKFLIDNGADVNDGIFSPLYFANDESIKKLLIKAGAVKKCKISNIAEAKNKLGIYLMHLLPD